MERWKTGGWRSEGRVKDGGGGGGGGEMAVASGGGKVVDFSHLSLTLTGFARLIWREQ